MINSEQQSYIEEALNERERFYTQVKKTFNIDWDEIKQKIRIHFFNKIHLYDKKRDFKPWAKTVIYSQCKNQIRNQINYNIKRENTNYVWLMENYVEDNIFFKNKVKNISQKFFNSLCPKDKILFDLKFEENLSMTDIGIIMGQTRRNVYNRIERIKIFYLKL